MPPERSLEPGLARHEVQVGTRRRTYLTHLPEPLIGQPAWPIVLAFHGLGTSGRSMVEFSGLAETADRHGFLAVFPDGTGPTPQSLAWNAGSCCSWAHKDNVDEVGFVRAILAELAAAGPIDERRIYATGFSNGAMLAYWLAAHLAERIAAIAPVAGPMAADDCHPSRPVPVCHFHGLADQFAPPQGGFGPRSAVRMKHKPLQHTLDCWIRANGCAAAPEVEHLPPEVDDGTRVTRRVWKGSAPEREVTFYAIAGAGHVWPGRASPFTVLGPTTANLDAGEVMWEFFSRHARR